MSDNTKPATPVTGKAADILARAQHAAGNPDKVPQAALVADDALKAAPAVSKPPSYPKYRLPVAPCTVHFGVVDGEEITRVFVDGVAQATNDREQKVLEGMLRAGNIYPLEVSPSKFGNLPDRSDVIPEKPKA